MDSDFWTSRLAAAKRQFNLQHHHHHSSQLDRLNIDDLEVEDEVRPEFPCPYCYEDYDIVSLCSHLEDEHSCESKVAVCPICSIKVVSDMLSHFTLQHGHLFKMQRRRRLRRVAIPNSQALSLLGRDLREAHLQVLLGGSGYRSSNANSSNAVTDPFLSSLILNFPSSESEDISKSVLSSADDSSVKSVTSSHRWKASFDPSLSYEKREKRKRQAAERVVFLQDLLVSTLLDD
ncbi:protein DEHYDRATION-INDUCED 19 homolog 4-like [Camellia sinensis]|uniref:protein DEHYDRATION-INDUCED 19 homolog 4-like n=1 Tax=Camellia sinensis TaxID=4442 RepID=UPI0010358033|nr:protein DEHYDRATION-INDUCED 19 homolog 4-like [Camellia sinensis]